MMRIAQISLLLLCAVPLWARKCHTGLGTEEEGDRCYVRKFSNGAIEQGAGKALPCDRLFSVQRSSEATTFSCTNYDFCNTHNLEEIIASVPDGHKCIFEKRAKREDKSSTDDETPAHKKKRVERENKEKKALQAGLLAIFSAGMSISSGLITFALVLPALK